jgi:hypothetical protein
MNPAADAPAVHWTNDPVYETQVHYDRQTPCLLRCSPPIGPAERIEPGETFESFRVFELSPRQHRARAARAGRAPRLSRARAVGAGKPHPDARPQRRPDAVKEAIDQCAEVGFEMVIMTFGSGFNMENEKPEYLAQSSRWRITDGQRCRAGWLLRCWPAVPLTRPTTPSIRDGQTGRRAFWRFALPGQPLGRKLFPQASAIFRADRLRRAGK